MAMKGAMPYPPPQTLGLSTTQSSTLRLTAAYTPATVTCFTASDLLPGPGTTHRHFGVSVLCFKKVLCSLISLRVL